MDQVLKVQTVVRDPRISLTMIAQYIAATQKRRMSILKGCKYPPDYIPRFYEMARKLVCGLFEGNFIDQQELYFLEFSRQATIYRKDAKDYEERKDGYKNRVYSAKGLDALVAMEHLLTPILRKYNLKSNLSKTKNSITLNSVRIGAKADMLLFDQLGTTQVGFLTFHFSSAKLKREEAATKLCVLSKYYQAQDVILDPKSCILVDVTGWRLYTLFATPSIGESLDQVTKEIQHNWDLT